MINPSGGWVGAGGLLINALVLGHGRVGRAGVSMTCCPTRVLADKGSRYPAIALSSLPADDGSTGGKSCKANLTPAGGRAKRGK